MPDKIIRIKMLNAQTPEALELLVNNFLATQRLLTEDFLDAKHTVAVLKEASGSNPAEFCYCMTIIYREDV